MMKAKLLLALALLAGGATFAQAGVFVGVGFGYHGYYGGCYRCGYYPRRVWGYGWYRPWYRGYWRAGYWARPAYVGAYSAPPAPVAYVPPAPAPIAYAPPAPAPAPAPAPTCAPCPPAPAAKTCVRKHHHRTVAHHKVTRPCTSTPNAPTSS